MKAWDDLVSDQTKQMYWTDDSDWYVDMGVKIEKFHKDGRIELHNVMTRNDKYEPITEDNRWDEIYPIFVNEGWMKGCCQLNVMVHNEKLNRINDVMRRYISSRNERMIEQLRENRIFVQKKINKYRNLLTKYS